MYRLGVWPPVAIVLGVFLIDLCAYALHVSMHSVRLFWRLHRASLTVIQRAAPRPRRFRPRAVPE
jgi:hypothetical protein